MYSKHGDGTQMFKLAPVKGSDFSHIESGAAAGLVLEPQDRSGNQGTALVLANRSSRSHYQHFKPVPVPGKQDTYCLECRTGSRVSRHGTAPFAVRGVGLHRCGDAVLTTSLRPQVIRAKGGGKDRGVKLEMHSKSSKDASQHFKFVIGGDS